MKVLQINLAYDEEEGVMAERLKYFTESVSGVLDLMEDGVQMDLKIGDRMFATAIVTENEMKPQP